MAVPGRSGLSYGFRGSNERFRHSASCRGYLDFVTALAAAAAPTPELADAAPATAQSPGGVLREATALPRLSGSNSGRPTSHSRVPRPSYAPRAWLTVGTRSAADAAQAGDGGRSASARASAGSESRPSLHDAVEGLAGIGRRAGHWAGPLDVLVDACAAGDGHRAFHGERALCERAVHFHRP